MSRLDAEFNPAEQHTLDRIAVTRPAAGPGDTYRHFYVCGCGDFGEVERDATGAREAHEAHRDHLLGIGCG